MKPLLPLFLSLLFFPATSVADREETPVESLPARAAYRPLDHLEAGGEALVSRDGLLILLSGATLSGISYPLFDDRVEAHYAKTDRLGGLSTFGDYAGQGYLTIPLAAGFLLGGWIFDSPPLLDSGIAHTESFLTALGLTYLLKFSVRRYRPGSSNRESFPSGHTTIGFATAAWAHSLYGWKAGIPAYLIAGIIGWSRINDRAHHLSDVLAGATIGSYFGYAFSRHHRDLPPEKEEMVWLPLLLPGGGGVTWSAAF